PDPRLLHVATMPCDGDPMAVNLREGMPIGGLGIEFHSRRRNRVNGKVTLDRDGRGFSIHVDQSFGNCAQYIQARRLRPLARRGGGSLAITCIDHFDQYAQRLIAQADTFFIASHFGGDPTRPEHGADVSHRGGMPGFVRVEDRRTLVFPDYRGNFFFNTLGNLAANPRCGLLFIDFDHGGTLQLAGAAEIQWDFPRDNPAFEGAQRLVRMRVEQAVHVSGALALESDFIGYAPQFARRRSG
ncbi:MAG: pyridoxamine 5'-phosphate oxidase family protein, partial [Candidatus Binataceae bacterium]